MVGRKLIRGLAVGLTTALLFTGCNSSESLTPAEEQQEVKIGITQIIEHPALDSAREGFIEGLKLEGYEEGKNLKIDLQNAQGEISTAQMIAQKFVQDKQDMILAIATPTAQAAYQTTKDIPILITAVTDPVIAGIAKDMNVPGTNVTGTSDMTPIKKQFEMMKQLLPSAKKVGVLYNTSEANSIVQVDIAKKEAQELGLEIIEGGITNINEVQQGAEALAKSVDVIYVPTDNTIVSSIAIVVNAAEKEGIAVIGSEKGQVEQGALATEGLDYYELGKQTAKIAVKVLQGASPAETPIEMLKETKLIINEATAKKLNITIPEDLKAKAELIGK